MSTSTRYKAETSEITVTRNLTGEWSLGSSSKAQERQNFVERVRSIVPFVEYRWGEFWHEGTSLTQLKDLYHLEPLRLSTSLLLWRDFGLGLDLALSIWGFLKENPDCSVDLTKGILTTYKTVQTDYTDFRTGTLIYTVGKTLEVQNCKVGDPTCGVGIHSSGVEFAVNYAAARPHQLLQLTIPLRGVLSASTQKVRSRTCRVAALVSTP